MLMVFKYIFVFQTVLFFLLTKTMYELKCVQVLLQTDNEDIFYMMKCIQSI